MFSWEKVFPSLHSERQSSGQNEKKSGYKMFYYSCRSVSPQQMKNGKWVMTVVKERRTLIYGSFSRLKFNSSKNSHRFFLKKTRTFFDYFPFYLHTISEKISQDRFQFSEGFQRFFRSLEGSLDVPLKKRLNHNKGEQNEQLLSLKQQQQKLG